MKKTKETKKKETKKKEDVTTTDFPAESRPEGASKSAVKKRAKRIVKLR